MKPGPTLLWLIFAATALPATHAQSSNGSPLIWVNSSSDNHGGAGGRLGTGIVVRANPDGHTLLVMGTGYAANAALYKLGSAFHAYGPHELRQRLVDSSMGSSGLSPQNA